MSLRKYLSDSEAKHLGLAINQNMKTEQKVVIVLVGINGRKYKNLETQAF